MAPRVVLLVTSPRLPAGLLSAQAWDLLRAHPVLAGAPSPQVAAVRAQGVAVGSPEGEPVAALLAAADRAGTAVWLAAPDGDEAVARRLGLLLAREPGRATLEVLPGSWDPPGARLLDVVAVVDRLLSPGGDPWKRGQTHRSLAPYLVEECYETYDAIEADDLPALREELGDLLLQVVLHARLAEAAAQPWTVDDVAGDLAAKLVRRSPHVFGDARVSDPAEITGQWERIKRAEKGRTSAFDGVAVSQPALALAAQVHDRAARAGLPAGPAGPIPAHPDEDALGAALLALVAAARAAGQDPEAALRRAVLARLATLRAAETAAAAGPR
ncbi:nucleoside triphosphate pyrophosphohydrolase [Pilimelia terevasa]|uniref:Nucleoside triphosphate pyrophosphohydrolase n=1 Tax=Pilimelia terevasa TaxID=53372 RepID=A0A8J3BH67_9ACTN|nr:MazG family protein [Pilimelia terevasa]GGK14662.1 nucleoside triphosphate pyrophosphohydrolase [Pilimelia terevasa]